MEVRRALAVVINHTSNDAASEFQRAYNRTRDQLAESENVRDDLEYAVTYEQLQVLETDQELTRVRRHVVALRYRLWRARQRNIALKKKLAKERKKNKKNKVQ